MNSCSAIFDLSYQALAYAIFISQGLLAFCRRKAGFYLSNLFIGDLHPSALFLRHVGVVIGQRAKKKMFRVDARSIIASVKDIQLRILPIFQIPRYTVSRYCSAAVVDLPISLGEFPGSPDPTISLRAMPRSLINLWPESLRERAKNMLAMNNHTKWYQQAGA